MIRRLASWILAKFCRIGIVVNLRILIYEFKEIFKGKCLGTDLEYYNSCLHVPDFSSLGGKMVEKLSSILWHI